MLIKKEKNSVTNIAGVAKLEDALALGASGSNPMEVQVLSPAQEFLKYTK